MNSESLLSTPVLPVESARSIFASDREQLGLSIWLLILLREWVAPPGTMVHSGRTVSASEIASALGIGERQARRELQRLRKAGWVELRNTGRGYQIRLTRGADARSIAP